MDWDFGKAPEQTQHCFYGSRKRPSGNILFRECRL